MPGRQLSSTDIDDYRPEKAREFEVRDAGGRWSPLWIKVVNFAAFYPENIHPILPTTAPTRDGSPHRRDGQKSVYTIHPPHFTRR
jgi:hypothetical protein